eukprot:gene7888-9707_t
MEEETTTTTTTTNNDTAENVEKEKEKVEIKIYKTNKDDLEEANELKVKGNQSYTKSEYQEAIKYYTDAISLLKGESITNDSDKKIIEIKDENEQTIECNQELAIYYSNRAACYLSLKENEKVVEDCNESLLLIGSNISSVKIKVLHRRAQAQESLDKLRESLDDYKAILELDPTFPQARQAQHRLPPKIKEKEEKERAEMMSKLKDLGNMILGKFGMSTDNFQFVKDPNTGGYSVNIKK